MPLFGHGFLPLVAARELRSRPVHEQRPQLVPELTTENKKTAHEHQISSDVPPHGMRIEAGQMVV
jgi:hypothetical protein